MKYDVDTAIRIARKGRIELTAEDLMILHALYEGGAGQRFLVYHMPEKVNMLQNLLYAARDKNFPPCHPPSLQTRLERYKNFKNPNTGRSIRQSFNGPARKYGQPLPL